MNGRGGPIDVRPRGAAAAEQEQEDRTTRNLLTFDGFDPDYLNKVKVSVSTRDGDGYTPMTYYSATGNVTMVRYLIAHGADGRKEDRFGWWPLYAAASVGHVEIIMLLLSQVDGAHEDVRKVTSDGWSPVRIALHRGHFDVAYWFLLNGALWSPQDGWFPWWRGRINGGIVPGRGRGWTFADDMDNDSMSDATLRSDRRPRDSCKRAAVLTWAHDIVTHHETIVTVLLTGTIDVSASTVRRHPDLASSPLVIFNGKSGVLKLIAQYMAEKTPQQVRMLRQLLVLLPAFIDDTPFVEVEEEDTPFVEEDEEEEEDEDVTLENMHATYVM